MSNGTATTTTSPAKTPPNIGPGAIATPSVDGGPAFSLAATEWIAIQTYVMDGLTLPTNDDQFKKYVGPGAPADLTPFADLLTCFSGIYSQGSTCHKPTNP